MVTQKKICAMMLFLFISSLHGMDCNGLLQDPGVLTRFLIRKDFDTLKNHIKNGANVNEDTWGISLAWRTIDMRENIDDNMMIELFKLYSRYGLDVHHKVGSKTLVHNLAIKKMPFLLKVVISAGADVNAKDKDGDTPLHGALWYWSIVGGSCPLMVKKLILAGADVNVQNDEGKTPLHYAIKDKQIVALLLFHNARYEIKDHKGKTPYDRAKDFEVKEMLKEQESVNKVIVSHVSQEKFGGLSTVHALRNRECGKPMKLQYRPSMFIEK